MGANPQPAPSKPRLVRPCGKGPTLFPWSLRDEKELVGYADMCVRMSICVADLVPLYADLLKRHARRDIGPGRGLG